MKRRSDKSERKIRRPEGNRGIARRLGDVDGVDETARELGADRLGRLQAWLPPPLKGRALTTNNIRFQPHVLLSVA